MKPVFLNSINKNIKLLDPETTNLDYLNQLGYKTTYIHNKKSIFIIIPKEELKDKEVIIKDKPISEKTLSKQFKSKGKYSNYSNLTFKNNSIYKDNQLTKNMLINIEGLTNIDNFKFKYEFSNNQSLKKIHANKASFIWEELKNIDISFGINKFNSSLQSLKKNQIIGLTISSKKDKDNTNYIDKKIKIDQQSQIKLFINDKEVSNLILNEGTTNLKNIPLNFGKNTLKIQTFDLKGKLLHEKQTFIFSKSKGPFNWFKIKKYDFTIGNNTYENNERSIASSTKINTILFPVETYSKLGQSSKEYSFLIRPFTLTTISNRYQKTNNSLNKNISFSTQKVFQKETPYLQRVYFNSSSQHNTSIQNLKNFQLTSISTGVDLKKIFKLNPSIFIAQTLSKNFPNSYQLNINLGYGYQYDNEKNIYYQNNINLKIEKKSSQKLVPSLQLNNQLKIKQKNIIYTILLSDNGLEFNAKFSWQLGKLTKLENTIGLSGINNNIMYSDKENNFDFSAQNEINKNKLNITAGYRYNDDATNTIGQFNQDLKNSTRQDNLSLYTRFGSILYNFKNDSNTYNSDITVKTAIAFADGHFGIKDKIDGSFIIVKPKKNLQNTSITINGEALSLFNSLVITNLKENEINKFSIELNNKDAILMLPKNIYTVPIKKNKGEALIIDTESSNIAIGTLLLPNKNPITYKLITYYNEISPEKKLNTLTSKSGKIQLIGVKAGETYILDTEVPTLKKVKLKIPKWVEGIYKIPPITFDKKEIKEKQ